LELQAPRYPLFPRPNSRPSIGSAVLAWRASAKVATFHDQLEASSILNICATGSREGNDTSRILLTAVGYAKGPSYENLRGVRITILLPAMPYLAQLEAATLFFQLTT